MTPKTPVAARPTFRALLADGGAVLVRRLGPSDRDQVAALHEQLPLEDAYLRFFSPSPGNARVAALAVAPEMVSFGAFGESRLLGVAHYRREPTGTAPEIAMAVAHDAQHRGIGSLLLEQLVSTASREGVAHLVADVLAVNHRMMRVLLDSGLPHRIEHDGSVTHLVIDVPTPAELEDSPEGLRYLDVLLDRETGAEVASLRSMLRPRGVVVIGAGRRSTSVGTMVLRGIVTGGYRGAVHVVHREATEIEGVGCVRRVADLPTSVDLAVLCVPAAAVPDVAEECGRHGIKSLLVISSGVSTDPSVSGRLEEVIGRYGMRMVGPNCLGLVNTEPEVRLQASFAEAFGPGHVGVAAQSGGVLIGLAKELDKLGLGVSSAVSVGDALDVNADDLLLWWAQDGRTRAAVLYTESIRRPAQFARIAARLSRTMPVLSIRSGSSSAGRAAAVSHSAGAATPRVLRDALCTRAGVLAVDSTTELLEALAVLSWQPLPQGSNVAVLSNAGGVGVLAADACARHGLSVASLTEESRQTLRTLLPPAASLGNPVDATATVSADTFRAVAATLTADPNVDAVIVIAAATRASDPLAELDSTLTLQTGKPLLAVDLGQPVGVQRLAQPPAPDMAAHAIPSFADPDAAARALSLVARRARWLRRPDIRPSPPRSASLGEARDIVSAALREQPVGGWLDPARAFELARAAGIPTAALTVVKSPSEAVEAWRNTAGPVVLKADVPGLVHKSRAGAVAGWLDSAEAVRQGFERLTTRFTGRLRAVTLAPMLNATGPELLVGLTSMAGSGSLLTVGLGGTATDLVDDRAHCLVPATQAELDDMLDGLRSSRALFASAEGLVLRRQLLDVVASLSWLAVHVPQVVEAEINPLLPTPSGVFAVDVRIRVEPRPAPEDPWQRTLPA